MKRSTDRILTTHSGALRRPDDLMRMVSAKDRGEAVDDPALQSRIRSATKEAIRDQLNSGLDVVNDGEFPKTSWMGYYHSRIKGIEKRPAASYRAGHPLYGRDSNQFPGWYALAARIGGPTYSPMLRIDQPPQLPAQPEIPVCAGPLSYIGHDETRFDIENLKTASAGSPTPDLFLSAIGPSMLEWSLPNAYYKTPEEYVFAVAGMMHEEYKLITDAGIVLQLDEPTLVTNWSLTSWAGMTLEEYRRWLSVRVEAMNFALKSIDSDMVRVHFCWGSWHAPHSEDIPLSDVLDIILKLKVGAFSFEASNPRHAHEAKAWEQAKLPQDKILIPGIVGHFSDFIEHPELIAERILRYTKIVGRENVIAGTDCGIGSRVGHPEVCWAKFKALSEGARIASRHLWGG
jgi:5-methyltetrahydropteroyltriglutamate--homocysteine methyltransferase